MIEDEYYKKYLDNKLELLFNDNGEVISDNLFPVEQKKEEYKEENKKEQRYTIASRIPESEIREIFPYHHDLNMSTQGIRLDNGVMGFRNSLGRNTWNFKCPSKSWNSVTPVITCECNPSEVRLFDNGYYSIGCNLFDNNNNLISKGNNKPGFYYDIYSDKYFVLKSNTSKEKHLIDMEGKEFSPEIENSGYEVRDQCILVKLSYGYSNFNDFKRCKVFSKNGEQFYQGNSSFSIIDEEDGMLILKSNSVSPNYYGKNYLTCNKIAILEDGTFLDDGHLFSEISVIDKDVFLINRDGTYKVIRKDGTPVVDTIFSKILPQTFKLGGHDYLRGRSRDHKDYLFDLDGNILFKKPYDRIDVIDSEYAQIAENNEFKIIDREGNVVYNHGKEPFNSYLKRYNNCFLNGEKEVIVIPNARLKSANVVKQLFGYSYDNGNEKVRVKSEPVMLYGDFQALCLTNQKQLLLYNMLDKSYKPLGLISNVRYNDHFIETSSSILYPYKGKLLDITDFYNKNLKKKEKITINPDVGEIYTKDEFIEKNSADLKLLQLQEDLKNEKLREEQRKAQERLDAQRKEEEIKKQELLRKQEEDRKLKELSQQKSEEREKSKALKAQYLSQMREIAKNFALLEGGRKINRITVRDLLDDYGDHFGIKEEYRDYLDVIDLSSEAFKNVKMTGLNFNESNAMFDPQVVYNKDLSNSTFEKVHFSPFANFSGVNIEGSIFSFDDDPLTLDSFNSTFSNAKYDDITRINGQTVEEFLNKNLTAKQK